MAITRKSAGRGEQHKRSKRGQSASKASKKGKDAAKKVNKQRHAQQAGGPR